MFCFLVNQVQFLNTRNLTELYVWRFHYTIRKVSSFQILAACKLKRGQRNRRRGDSGAIDPPRLPLSTCFCSRSAIHALQATL